MQPGSGLRNAKMSPNPVRIIVWIIVAIVLVILWLSWRTRQNRSSHGAQEPAGNQPSDPQAYVDLRSLMLQGSRQKFDLPAASSPTEPFGVLMDWGIPNGTATVVAMADGNASVYLSSGGGFIGGGQAQESIRAAAKRTVSLAGEVQSRMHATTTYPLPQTGQVTFYALTDAGVFTASASEDDLRSHRSPFSKLGDSAQAIITEYRRTQE